MISLLNLRNQTNLLLAIRSIVLQRQLISTIGWQLAGFEIYLLDLDIEMIVAIFHECGNLLFIQISLNIVRR